MNRQSTRRPLDDEGTPPYELSVDWGLPQEGSLTEASGQLS